MKKVISVLIAFTLVLSLCLPLFAANEIPVTVSRVTGKLGDEVTVTVSVGAGSATTNGQFSLSYDSTALEYVTYKTGSVLSSAYAAADGSKKGTFSFAYILVNPTSTAGNMVEVTFKIISSDSTEIPLKINIKEFQTVDSTNINYSEIPYKATDGAVVVDISSSTASADVNRDGTADQKDIDIVVDYILGVSDRAKSFDLNSDGVCDVTDLVSLRSIIENL